MSRRPRRRHGRAELLSVAGRRERPACPGRRAFLKQAAAATVLGPLGVQVAFDTLATPRAARADSVPAIQPSYRGMKPHPIKQYSRDQTFGARAGELRFLHLFPGAIFPFGLAQMDDDEVVLVCSYDDGQYEKPVVAFSSDGGRTWSDFTIIPDVPQNPISTAANRPVGLAYLGNGELCFQLQTAGMRLFSHDHGRTWPERIAVVPPPGGDEVGAEWGLEGNPLIERDANGIATRIAEIRWLFPRGSVSPVDPAIGMIHWSTDGGRTWTPDVMPPTWTFTATESGTTYRRGVSEGSLVRAANGALVAGLRTDMLPRYFPFNTGALEGVGVSISSDDGATWSPLQVVFDAGRHHQQVMRLPSGDLLMTYVVRNDIRRGTLASYRRGFEAIVSHDGGRTWEIAQRYVLDDFEYRDRPDDANWFYGACGHQATTLLNDGAVLSAYANYLTNGVTMIRWSPRARTYRDFGSGSA